MSTYRLPAADPRQSWRTVRAARLGARRQDGRAGGNSAAYGAERNKHLPVLARQRDRQHLTRSASSVYMQSLVDWSDQRWTEVSGNGAARHGGSRPIEWNKASLP